MKYVLNAEPFNYSSNAILNWEKLGYRYKESSWEIIEQTKQFANVEILIVRLARRVDDSIIVKFPGLAFVVSATTGSDHIDLDLLKKRNIQLLSLKGYNDFLKTIPSTAEHTWALLLSLIRNIPAASNDVRIGNWDRDKFRGIQLKGKSIGIVGMGRTGTKVANYAKAFEMNIFFFDPFVPFCEGIYSETTLCQLVKKSEIISLHVHLSKETRYMVNKNVLEHAQKGLFIINTSRGQIIKEDDLKDYFEDNTIKGLAVDVLSDEYDNIENSLLWRLQKEGHNVLITPHIAGATYDAMNSCEDFISELFVNNMTSI